MHGLEKDPDEVTVVKFVDGDFVKVQKDMNFRETTHEKCAPYADGIWVDANMPMREWPFLLYRSAHEYRSMTQDELSEDVAKKQAQKGERELLQIIEQIERRLQDKAEVAEDIKEIYVVAKSEGFDTKIMRIVIRERAMDEAAREERDMLVDTYMRALGDYASSPLGLAAIARVGQ